LHCFELLGGEVLLFEAVVEEAGDGAVLGVVVGFEV